MRVLVFLTVALALAPLSHADVLTGTEEQIQKTSEPILANVLDGFFSGDYEKYARDFDTMLKETVTPEKFAAAQKQLAQQLGKYESSSYLGSLRKGQMTLTLWKGRFSATQDDILIKLVLTKREEKILVTGLWFQ